jgi:hypothetical protein
LETGLSGEAFNGILGNEWRDLKAIRGELKMRKSWRALQSDFLLQTGVHVF